VIIGWGAIDIGGLDIEVSDNTVVLPSGAAGPCIRVESVTGITVKGNTLDASAASNATAASSTGSEAIIRDNRMIRGAAGYGIIWSPTSGTNVDIHDNLICGTSTQNHLRLFNTTDVDVHHNTIEGTPIFLADGSAGITIRDNPGYNPVGVLTVAVPATTVAVAAAQVDRTFYVTANASGTTTIEVGAGPTITIPASACVAVLFRPGSR
jgi:hypothetical protein